MDGLRSWCRARLVPISLALASALGCAGVASPALANDASAALTTYVSQPDLSFAWREVGAGRIGAVEYVELILTSQTWRGIPWKHQLFLVLPQGVSHESGQALLFIAGGRWKAAYDNEPPQLEHSREARVFARLAEALRSPVGVLRQVPYQPIFQRREDALIAYSFDRYLETGETDWPLLLPMVKSAVRAMDAMQQASRERWGLTIDAFSVAGASKRGWTTWLTAAIDSRVTAVAPMVIDVLNMLKQIDNQVATWGALSDQIREYADLDIPERLRTNARGPELLSIVDPYAYRERLTQSKLIVLATNDPYWPLDALGLYWDDLPGPKRVLYVPNQGHGIRDVDRLIGSVAALHRYAARREELPLPSWSFAPDTQRLTLTVQSDRTPKRVRLWVAQSLTRDFRSAVWSSTSCKRRRGHYLCATLRDGTNYTAAFAELTFKDRNEPEFSLSTTVCIAPPPTDQAQPNCQEA